MGGLRARMARVARTTIPRRSPDAAIPLTSAQERLWFLSRTADDTYLCWAAHRLTGPLDPKALAAALTEVVNRHEALRTSFTEENGRATQIVHAHVEVVLDYVIGPAHEAVAEFLGRGFDLATGPLIRALLVETGVDEHVFVLCLHHLISDGETVGVIFGEVYALYRGEVLPEVKVQFPDYAVWASGRRDTSAADYWRRELDGAPGFLPLPTDRVRPSRATHRGDRCSVPLPQKVAEGIRRADHTPFMVVMAALAVVLARLADVDDVVVGSPVADRDHPDLEQSVGFYVNTLAFRTRLAGNPTLGDVLAQVRETTMSGLDHRSLPFDVVVDMLGGRRDLSFNPIFQVMLVTGEPGGVHHPAPGLTAESWALSAPPARFDMTVIAEATHLHIDYATDLFDAPTVTRFAHHLIRVLEVLTTTPDIRVWDIPLATIPT
ncbi:condensation domain-containing protein, partial [Acrocarpospora phusangensis]|uniref:condensation domain-containing protein n=1 Tax=Acrocarpospora phusangensis TaxID=1070424 RepID=UPI001EF28139